MSAVEGRLVYPAGVVIGVKLFAGLRERAGVPERDVELPAGATVGDVWDALDLGDEPDGLLYAVNREYARRETRVREGDEVAVIPPVSGGEARGGSEPRRAIGEQAAGAAEGAVAGMVRASEGESRFWLSKEPLSVEAAVAQVQRDDAGAIATFIGTTRTRSRERDVVRLEYEAYGGMAEAEMTKLAAELQAKYGVLEVAIHHRVGIVAVGETSVVIAVSAPHRAEALAACREAIDTLKVTVPLWKKEVYDGGTEWIGTGS